MKFIYTPHFKRDFKSLPQEIRQKFKKQAHFLLKYLRHPSLRAKKYDEKRNIWQARINRNYRFYFLIKGNSYILLEVKSHPK